RLLFGAGADGEADAGGVLSYNYLSGEHQTAVPSGRPLLVREQEARFSLENVMRAQLYGAVGALAVGMEVLLKDEGVQLDVMYAHGGIFRTDGVAQQVLADALATPVAVGDSAGEGGAWGMALLAAFTAQAPGRPRRQAGSGHRPRDGGRAGDAGALAPHQEQPGADRRARRRQERGRRGPGPVDRRGRRPGAAEGQAAVHAGPRLPGRRLPLPR